MAGITDKSKAKKARKKKKEEQMSPLEKEISQAFHEDMDKFHGLNKRDDYELDIKLLKDQIDQMENKEKDGDWDDSIPTFSPSGASKCERELAFKEYKMPKDEIVFEPFQKRWVRNGSAVHQAFQRDLAYMEREEFSRFEVMRTQDGKYAWERNIRRVRQFEHNGVRFQMYGMTDGFLYYSPRKMRIGVDLKTKSTTIASVGDYKLKVPQDNNIQQMVAYSLLFDVDHWLIPYESLAKDFWTKGKEARNDMKVFTLTITDKMKNDLLDKFAEVAKDVNEGAVPPPDFSKCLFCPFKTVCAEFEEELKKEEQAVDEELGK